MDSSKYQRTVMLDSRAMLTVTAWKIRHAVQHQEELLQFIALTSQLVRDETEDTLAALLDADYMKAIQRMLEHSVSEVEELDKVSLIDLPDLIQAMWELNQLEKFLGKSHALATWASLKLVEAQKIARETLERAGVTPPES